MSHSIYVSMALQIMLMIYTLNKSKKKTIFFINEREKQLTVAIFRAIPRYIAEYSLSVCRRCNIINFLNNAENIKTIKVDQFR